MALSDIVIHTILSVALVVLILLHSGKGGVSGIFGGGMSETFSGTSVIEKNLTRVTVAVATAFLYHHRPAGVRI